MPKEEYQKRVDEVLTKECLCIGLSNAAAVNYKEPFLKNLKAVTICPGPNIANYSKIAILQEMTDHLYGRKSLVTNKNRPHMLVKELELYLKYFLEQLKKEPAPDKKMLRNFNNFGNTLLEGIFYYRQLQQEHVFSEAFETALDKAENQVKSLLQNL